MTVTHPDYAILAARIAVSNLHKQTKKQFSQVVTDLFNYVNPVSTLNRYFGMFHADFCRKTTAPAR